MSAGHAAAAVTAADRWSPWTARGIRWSWSSMARYQACPRAFELGVVEDLVTLDYQPALSLGVAFHAGMEAAFRRLRDEQVRAGRAFWRPTDRGLGVLADLAGAAARDCPGVTAEDGLKAERIARAYVLGDTTRGRGGPEDFACWRILRVEETVSADLSVLLPPAKSGGRRRRVPWTQTPDLVVEAGGDEDPHWHGLWAVDHKSAASFRGTMFWAWRRDGQALAQTAVLRAAGIPVRGFVPNIVTKQPRVRAVREYVEFDDAEVAEFAATLAAWQRAIQARRFRPGAPWPQAHAACMSRYGACEFWSLCHEGPRARALYGRRDETALSAVADFAAWEVAE